MMANIAEPDIDIPGTSDREEQAEGARLCQNNYP